MDELVAHQLQRLEALLSPERTRLTLEKTDPEYSPDELGALVGIGYFAKKPDVQVSVYVFPDWSKHREVAEQLKGEVAGDAGIYARTVTNGPMLIFAHTRIDKRDRDKAESRLHAIISAFSGDE